MKAPLPIDEKELILAAQNGDIKAFTRLVELHQRSVRACLAVRMNHAVEAEDLAQEVLLVAFRKLPSVDPSRPLGPWLRGIAINLLANHRRKFRATPIGLNEELQTLVDARIEDQLRNGSESAQMGALRDCLEDLDGPARVLVHARYAEGASLEDLAQSLGRKTSAVSMQLHRLRSALANCVDRKIQASTP